MSVSETSLLLLSIHAKSLEPTLCGVKPQNVLHKGKPQPCKILHKGGYCLYLKNTLDYSQKVDVQKKFYGIAPEGRVVKTESEWTTIVSRLKRVASLINFLSSENKFFMGQYFTSAAFAGKH